MTYLCVHISDATKTRPKVQDRKVAKKERMESIEQRILVANLVHEYFAKKRREPNYESNPGCEPTPYYTYEVEVAEFDNCDFHATPDIRSLRVRISDDYLRLLQWQMFNTNSGVNVDDDDVGDIFYKIKWDVEDTLYSDGVVGTYAIYLTEVKRDVGAMVDSLRREVESKIKR